MIQNIDQPTDTFSGKFLETDASRAILSNIMQTGTGAVAAHQQVAGAFEIHA
jgi:ethanolamine ammonia-lyase small subunit